MNEIFLPVTKDWVVGKEANPNTVKWLMRRAELEADMSLLCDLARVWKEWVGEPAEAERVIGLAVAKSSDWWNIDKVLDLLDATDPYARPMLIELETKERRCRVLLLIAEKWRKLFGDNAREDIERILGEIENYIKNQEGSLNDNRFDVLNKVSIFWHDLGENSKAKEMLDLAVDAAKSLDHYWSLASAWKNWYGNNAKARNCLEKAEKRCDFKDIIKLLSAWKEWFNDDEAVKRLLRMGEQLAIGVSYDLFSLAEAWMEWYGEAEEAKRLLKIAENEPVADFKDILRIAGAWQKWFQDETMVKRLLETLEARAKNCSDFASLAEGWAEWLNDHAHARTLLKKSEESAVCCRDRVDLAAIYRRVLDDSENEQRLLKSAEQSARWFYQLEQLAAIWRDDFGDDAEADRLHTEAERLRKEQENED
ncbi:MAG: hypothetical protein JJU29_01795 [Verrucomicrobia bacterium]|nr:hypothetical protein [Verrucomicrobiota bacterium]MCH8510966.1 hypothetical protein [Kiritimatiellia bacterium]